MPDKKRSFCSTDMKKGFTLVELVVGFGLLAVLLGTANVMLFSALRGARKAGAVGVANAGGSYAMNAMVPVVKFARSISCNGGINSNRLDVRDFNDNALSYQFVPGGIVSVLTAPPTTTNLTSPNVAVVLCPDGQPVFRCNATTNPSTVVICFSANVAGTPITGEGGAVNFQSQVVLRNFGN